MSVKWLEYVPVYYNQLDCDAQGVTFFIKPNIAGFSDTVFHVASRQDKGQNKDFGVTTLSNAKLQAW